MSQQNSFVLTAYVCAEPSIKCFESSSVARFPISVFQGNNDRSRSASALINVECWRKNAHTSRVFAMIKKGARLTFSGFFKPEQWTDDNGTTHSRVVLRCSRVEPFNPESNG